MGQTSTRRVRFYKVRSLVSSSKYIGFGDSGIEAVADESDALVSEKIDRSVR